MSTQHSGAHRPEGPTSVIGGFIAATNAFFSNLSYALVRVFAPGYSARARYERRHQRLAGPRPGARLG